jgi:hypothetical protein
MIGSPWIEHPSILIKDPSYHRVSIAGSLIEPSGHGGSRICGASGEDRRILDQGSACHQVMIGGSLGKDLRGITQRSLDP